MNKFLIFVVLFFAAGCSTVNLEPQAVRENVIYDTDLGMDVDDAGALALLQSLADIGEVNVLGTISTSYDPYTPGALDAINTYYGSPNIPTARANNSRWWPVAYPYWWSDGLKRQAAKNIQTTLPNDTSPARVRNATQVYRQILSRQPNGSVTIVAVGFMNNLAELLNSRPDAYSRLTGTQLVAQKVKKLVTVLGPGTHLYVQGGQPQYGGVPTAYAKQVLDTWPTVNYIVPSDICTSFSVGYTLSSTTPVNNPVRRAYEVFTGLRNKGRPGWDLCAAYFAVRGNTDPSGTNFRFVTNQRMVVDLATKKSAWVTTSNTKHRRVYRVIGDRAIQQKFEYRVTKAPYK